MGGPRNKGELELFLRNMFNDKNILTIKSDMIRAMVAALIVWKRIDGAWENYEAIGGKSPLNDLTEKLIEKLQARLPEIFVTQAMRYTPPLTPKCIRELKQKGIKDVILLPLYPQYSTTTTKSSLEEFIEEAAGYFNYKVIEPFYKNDKFNDAVIEGIKEQYDEDFHLVFSAHGLPQKIIDNGDPYLEQLEEHVEILKTKLIEQNMEFNSINLAFQSKVGPMQWLEPSLEETLENLNNRKVIIYPISFIIDNSETDFELDIEYREIAEHFGIQEYRVCKCVNDNDIFVDAVLEMTDDTIGDRPK
jgi:ferrochelatase